MIMGCGVLLEMWYGRYTIRKWSFHATVGLGTLGGLVLGAKYFGVRFG